MEDQLVGLMHDPDGSVRAVAALALAHLARIHRAIDHVRLVPALTRLLGDPDARGNAQDAWDDIAVLTREQRAEHRSLSLMTATYPHRVFQLWEYRVNHGALLVRSPRGPDRTTNVDLLSAGVELISCPRLLRGLVVEHAGPDDVLAACAALGHGIDAPHEVFVLVSEGRRNLVVASSLRLHEHEGDIVDSPFADR